MFVASIEIYHPLNDPLVFDLVVEITPVNSLVEGGRIGIENCPVSFLN
jgi:hypothetical protein